ncbi:unnamed protein product [Lathyrus oleraceus]|uniref:Uncharacterized protein n=1 Tax=Pisum sativum TaxID=3888 RepID=A0A9D4YJT8_PEA|nr:hypothetical protein KIW84_023802 [Pisum sativum]
MKSCLLLVASVTAASAIIVPDSFSPYVSPHEGGTQRGKNGSSASRNKFTPRFDGLRFIETLITAHR